VFRVKGLRWPLPSADIACFKHDDYFTSEQCFWTLFLVGLIFFSMTLARHNLQEFEKLEERFPYKFTPRSAVLHLSGPAWMTIVLLSSVSGHFFLLV
jgi:hypothetical protein